MVVFFKSKNTESFLSVYVAIGFLLIIVSSKIDIIDIDFINIFEMINENKITIIIISILTLLSGIITSFMRRYC